MPNFGTSMMDQTHVMYYYWQQPLANTYAASFFVPRLLAQFLNSMPPVSLIQARKEALSGPMRIVPEGTRGAW